MEITLEFMLILLEFYLELLVLHQVQEVVICKIKLLI